MQKGERLAHVFDEVASSRTRLRIAGALSQRPRTLRELSEITGISVPGVLRHIRHLRAAGFLNEQTVRVRGFPLRRLYSLKGVHVVDFSLGDITVVKTTRIPNVSPSRTVSTEDLESLATEIMVSRRRIKERVKRLARMLNELSEDELRLVGQISLMDLDEDEKLILQTAFTEETLQDAEGVLARTQGIHDARRALEKAISKARRVAKK